MYNIIGISTADYNLFTVTKSNTSNRKDKFRIKKKTLLILMRSKKISYIVIFDPSFYFQHLQKSAEMKDVVMLLTNKIPLFLL